MGFCSVVSELTAHCVALARGRGLPSLRENRAPSPLPDVQAPERPRRAGVEAAEKVQLPSKQSWFDATSHAAMFSQQGAEPFFFNTEIMRVELEITIERKSSVAHTPVSSVVLKK